MPPSSTERGSSQENIESQNDFEKYLDIERGDVSLPPSSSNNQNQSQPQPTSASTLTRSSQQTKQFDPVEFVKSMISAGFTPSKAQIGNASSFTDGPKDSTNTWFAMFLQKLITQEKNRRAKSSKKS